MRLATLSGARLVHDLWHIVVLSITLYGYRFSTTPCHFCCFSSCLIIQVQGYLDIECPSSGTSVPICTCALCAILQSHSGPCTSSITIDYFHATFRARTQRIFVVSAPLLTFRTIYSRSNQPAIYLPIVLTALSELILSRFYLDRLCLFAKSLNFHNPNYLTPYDSISSWYMR